MLPCQIRHRLCINVPIDDDEFDKEAFIEEVRKFKCLWDINDPSYKERTTKLNAWKALSTIFRKDGTGLIQTGKSGRIVLFSG